MANQPTSSAKNVTGDSATFRNFMRRLMSVTHSEIKDKLDAEKKAKPSSHTPVSFSSTSRG